MGEYLKKAKQQKYIPGPSDLSIINDNLFFTLNGEKFYFARYDTKKDKITLHTKLMEGLPNIYKSTGRTGKEVIYAMDMPWLIEYAKMKMTILYYSLVPNDRIFTLYNDSFMWTTIQNYQVQQIERLIFY